MTMPRRMRSQSVIIGVTALAASSLSGCVAQPEYAAICTDPETNQRVDDDQCDDSEQPRDYTPGLGGFFWFYLATSSSRPVPAIGQRFDSRSGTYNGRALAGTGTRLQRGGLPTQGASSMKSYTRSGGFGTSRGVSSS